jgi:hypothetical protein
MIRVTLNGKTYYVYADGSVYVEFRRETRYGHVERTDRRLDAFGPTAKAARIEARRLGFTVRKPLRGTRRTGVEECEA